MASEALSDNKVEQSPKEDDSLDDSDANTPKQEPAPDENTVDEADSIVQNFSDPSGSDKEETAEDIAAEAEDIMSGFSGSKSSSSKSSSDPKEFAMGLGESSSENSR